MEKLTGKQARYLRGLGHSLKPVLQIGKAGITDAVVRQVHNALDTHELIKVKLIKSSPEETSEAAAELTERADCHLAQRIGKTLLLYRPRDESPTIVLPLGKPEPEENNG